MGEHANPSVAEILDRILVEVEKVVKTRREAQVDQAQQEMNQIMQQIRSLRTPSQGSPTAPEPR